MARHRESPIRRVNPSGKSVWVARYTGPDGARRSAGTFKLQREAQDAIDAAYQTPLTPTTVGAYLGAWTVRHPRSERTNRTNTHRVSRVLGVRVENRELHHWPLAELKRRHALELVDRLLRDQRRSPSGAVNILRALSAMYEDAITDEIADANPFKGVRVRASDPRAVKQATPARVYSFDDMHRLAAGGGRWEPMLRTLIDCGLRVGELFALERGAVDFDMATLQVTGSAWNGRVTGDSREKRHGRTVPVPPTCLAMLRTMPVQLHCPWLFPTPRGKLWRYDNWRRDVWMPARDASGLSIRPHDCRHSWVSQLSAAGIDPADLADIAGHSVETATARYRHGLGRSFDEVRRMVG